ERTRSTTATPIRWTWATSPWGAAVRTRARSRRTALTRLRLLHRKRTTAKALIVEAGDGLLGVVVVGVFDEGKAPGPTRLAIGWEIAVGDGPDGSEVLSNFRFCRFVRKIAHKQTNWHGRSTTPLAPDGSTGPGPVPGSIPAAFHPKHPRNPHRTRHLSDLFPAVGPVDSGESPPGAPGVASDLSGTAVAHVT